MKLKQIFLIDDDEDDKEIFLAALDELSTGVDCITADNGYDALNKIKANDVNPDLIFLDLNMPIMNGHVFLQKLRQQEQWIDIPVIILTTSSNAETEQEVKQLGVKEFITKPPSFDELTRILRRTLQITS